MGVNIAIYCVRNGTITHQCQQFNEAHDQHVTPGDNYLFVDPLFVSQCLELGKDAAQL
jgi:hypothetical protein